MREIVPRDCKSRKERVIAAVMNTSEIPEGGKETHVYTVEGCRRTDTPAAAAAAADAAADLRVQLVDSPDRCGAANLPPDPRVGPTESERRSLARSRKRARTTGADIRANHTLASGLTGSGRGGSLCVFAGSLARSATTGRLGVHDSMPTFASACRRKVESPAFRERAGRVPVRLLSVCRAVRISPPARPSLSFLGMINDAARLLTRQCRAGHSLRAPAIVVTMVATAAFGYIHRDDELVGH